MVSEKFRRSLSFRPKLEPEAEGQGSTSLPCRFDPFISKLERRDPRSLAHQPQSRPTARLDPRRPSQKLEKLHSSLDDLLQHPRPSIRSANGADWTAQRLATIFLRLADAYGIAPVGRSSISRPACRDGGGDPAERRGEDLVGDEVAEEGERD
ncbi:uncharacterized protein A4U43_C10F2290 [Asparagus officinalis]|uniref:Uncharacterized protein n=1 Tax=Asparagus officinalis TaxID=4686 RepID=A0A5P1E0B9_ASPOF|nr:uncharacterized protein A4U43_C10F2290 [Asparagus officinalis]